MTDASLVASGAVLMQKDGNGDLHPCAYYSKTFALAERNYDIYDRELLAVIRALEEWRQYLTGTRHPVTIITDHRNLTFFKSPQNLSRRQARWSMFMQDYDLVWDNHPGSQMGPADALSCRDEVDTSLDNTTITMLPTVSDVLIRALDVQLAEQIADFTTTDPLVKDATDAMAKHSSLFPCAACNHWTFLNGALYYKSRLYVPEPARQELVHSLHCSQAGGHGGYFRTVHLVQRDYWWPGLTTFVCQFVAGCATCQANKVNTHPTVPGLCPISSSASRPFQQVSCDMITDLPLSSGFDSILVVVNHGLTKGVIFIPCHKTIDTAGIAALFFKHIFARFGLHDKVISDRVPNSPLPLQRSWPDYLNTTLPSLLPTILRLMANLNRSTRSWRPTYESFAKVNL